MARPVNLLVAGISLCDFGPPQKMLCARFSFEFKPGNTILKYPGHNVVAAHPPNKNILAVFYFVLTLYSIARNEHPLSVHIHSIFKAFFL